MKLFLPALFLVVALHAPCQARLIPFISFEELLASSDVVAIVSPVQTQKNDEKLKIQGRDPNIFQGLTTECRVLGVLKGDIKAEESLSIVHFEYTNMSLTEPNGAGFISFPTDKMEYGLQIKDGEKVIRNTEGGMHPRFLVFLKKADDGSFIPTTGHYDANRSVFLLFDTFVFGYPLSP
jgi:hypothetical protein